MTFAIHGATKSKARAARRQLALNTLQSLAVQRRTRRSSLSHADAAQTLYAIRKLAETGSVLTVEKYLPMLLNLDGAPYTLAEHQPFAPLFRTQLPQRMVWRAGRQVAKCQQVCGTNRVTLANGRQVTGDQLEIGDKVVSFDRFKSTFGYVVDKIDAGQKQILKISTRMGSIVDIATTHPLRTLTGWKQASQLKVGDRIASARRGCSFGCHPLTDKVIALAYMIGDGCFGLSNNWNLTGDPGPLLTEFINVANKHENQGVIVRDKAKTTAKSVVLHRDNAILRWAKASGLAGKGSLTKFLPDWVFTLDEKAAAGFIARLWATDGQVLSAENGTPSIVYCSISPRLIYDLRAMLLKFGIPTSVSRGEAAYRDAETGERVQCNDAYKLRVETRAGWIKFLQTFDVPGKPPVPIPTTDENNNRDTLPIEVNDLIRDIAKSIHRDRANSLYAVGLRLTLKYALTYGKAREYLSHFERHCANHPRLPELQELVAGDVIWDEIESIEVCGNQPCWDIEVDTHHNYLLNGLLAHNSTSVMSSMLIRSNWIPNFKSLCICPLYEQIRRLSALVARPFIENSPVRSLWTGSNTQQSVLQYSFRNQSRVIFSFALLDASRVRGIATDHLIIDETQDFDKRHLPIVIECLSASKKWALEQYMGTPLTFDNTLEELFSKSSQAHWFTPCMSCGEYNIASQDYHLLKMIGPYRDDISADQPGTICHRCQRTINPAMGRWRHKYEDKHWDFAGYHVPQIIMPLHYASPKKWAALLRKQNSVAPHTFYNEVLGESYDVGSKLLTKTDLRNAACLPWRNEPRTSQPTRQIEQRLRYKMTALAIDWGGGGEKHESYTAMSLLGITAGGKIHVIWGRRLYTPNDHILEANEIVHWVNAFKPDIVVHDATGAGSLRESVLVQSRRLQNIKFVPIEYVGPMNSLVKYVPPSPENSRARWRVDKTRSLLYMIHGLRTGYIQTFAYDHVSEEEPGLLHDLLALVQEKVDGLSGRDVYRITRAQGASDDFAHSVNLGAVALWHSCNAWPNFYTAGKDHPDSGFVPFEEAVLQVAGDRTHGWETDPSPSFQPNVDPA